ncbi:hypothetical protein DPK73_02255 [Salmonella enterica subsp. enterica serovar Kintambo]|nr:hypothetical protein [Salmonella enterica subsp. enterica serovar Kintambo]
MNESFDKDFSNHTPMMQQYLSNQPNTMKKYSKYYFFFVGLRMGYIFWTLTGCSKSFQIDKVLQFCWLRWEQEAMVSLERRKATSKTK